MSNPKSQRTRAYVSAKTPTTSAPASTSFVAALAPTQLRCASSMRRASARCTSTDVDVFDAERDSLSLVDASASAGDDDARRSASERGQRLVSVPSLVERAERRVRSFARARALMSVAVRDGATRIVERRAFAARRALRRRTSPGAALARRMVHVLQWATLVRVFSRT